MTLNFDTICRTCMSQSQALMCIFEEQNASTNDAVVSMLTSITSIQVYKTTNSIGFTFDLPSLILVQAFKNDGLPENVCIGCLSEINRAFSFKTRSERSENTLRQYLNRLSNKSQISTSSVMSGRTDDGNYEIIEVDEESHITESSDNFKMEMENVESSHATSSNDILDRRKVVVLTSSENSPNPINVVYECHVCYDTFDSISLSEQHMTKFHASENAAKDANGTSCPICSLIVDDANALDRHIHESHSNDDEDFPYGAEDGHLADVVEIDETTISVQDECADEGIANEDTTKDEIVPVIVMNTNETTESELKFNCQKCGGKFAKERSLNIHIKLNKCTIKSFQCKICAKVFVRKKNLDCHMKTHAEPSDYSCKVCSEKFTQADKLAIHIQTQHEPSRKYLCPYCWKGKSKT